MQSFFKKLIPSSSTQSRNTDCDLRGFEFADSLEGGEAHEVLADWSKPIQGPNFFLVRKVGESNEWAVLEYQSMNFIMRASIEFEQDDVFTSSFDPKVAGGREIPGRVRVAIYLYQSNDVLMEGSNPAVVMISDKSRTHWTAYNVMCDACRYRRRRSSCTDTCDSSNPSSFRDGASACSFSVPSNAEDFRDLSSVFPSGQQVLRMSHHTEHIHGTPFTRVRLFVPAQDLPSCPAVRAPLVDLNGASSRSTVLESKAPVWSETLKALALEFRQRQVQPSRRNMQFVTETDSVPFSQIFRSGKSEYMIEFRCASPLSLVQAVCVFVSSSLWH
jgi:hypothetical protein